MRLDIAVLSGDGIGPEIIAQAVKTLDAIAHSFDHIFTFKEGLIGGAATRLTGSSLPKETLELCVQTDAILMGAIGDSDYDNAHETKKRPASGLLQLRKELGLYASIRPVIAYQSLLDRSPLRADIFENTDFIIYRELTGGIFFGEKKTSKKGTVASDLCEYSEVEIERITHLAFKAAQNRRKKLTLVDKANILASSQLWRNTVTRISKEYPDVTFNAMLVDNAAKQIILNPNQFDIILTENMFGNIIADEASIIGGASSLLASASVGQNSCLFEPVRGSYHPHQGVGMANPLAAVLCVAMLLDHFNLKGEARAVRDAIDKALELNITTQDLNKNNPLTTEKVGDFIYDYILNPEDSNMNFENIHVGQSTII
ncbi:3-isopropylmalate dehydrogenase [Aquimarina sp. ERC-38]|uniref:3-isopropylmalate dehydrogenase n=1 Tax=Aquimarina sp. ERC-38 TaxID=2949996 RepID=UPI0022455935|nr:3-isopropylmalate dehydrogenase [Aquimarina sp. ERC-38]UZO79705.1 3-isopropylmalate dehydrogenase [Aquimarina sp. ERC-38]